jgi:leucyl aminopeptidase
MNFRYKNDHMNGPVKPGTAIFLHEDESSVDKRPEIASFRRYFLPILEAGSFSGKFLENVNLFLPREETWLFLIGLGKSEQMTEARLIDCAAKAADQFRRLKLREGFICLPPLLEGLTYVNMMGLMVIGARLGAERAKNYKGDPEDRNSVSKTKTLYFQYLGSKDPVDKPQSVINKADILALAQLDARNLTDMPPNLLYPEIFANEAKKLALRNKLRISVWESDKLYREKAGAINAVGSGSLREPYLVILEYDGKPESTSPPLALVGKGVTFDSGGINLKPAEGLLNMKTDMAGAAVVLTVIQAISELALKVKVVGVIPLAENMTGSGAYRPGDIVSTMSGQTVEIVNTDAEGRLLLADALTVAQKYKPSKIIDIATLTGACQVALGNLYAGIFSNSPELCHTIISTGHTVGEAFWELPLVEDYEDELKSDLADFKQAGSRAGGAINAALFLQRFIRLPTEWVHLDIAGTARRTRPSPSCPEGATGFGVRTILRYLMNLSVSQKY